MLSTGPTPSSFFNCLVYSYILSLALFTKLFVFSRGIILDLCSVSVQQGYAQIVGASLGRPGLHGGRREAREGRVMKLYLYSYVM